MAVLSEYVSKQEVAALTGLNPRAVDRRIAEGAVALYLDPRDRRRRLVHREDVRRFTELVPVQRRADQAVDLAIA